MKVEISGISGAKDVLLALGLKVILIEAGVGCDSASRVGWGRG